jgi:hypothetical protein
MLLELSVLFLSSSSLPIFEKTVYETLYINLPLKHRWNSETLLRNSLVSKLFHFIFVRIWVIFLFDYAFPHAECEGTGDLNVEEQVSNSSLNPLDCIIKGFSNH